jgi:hypothetical protein
MKRFLMSLCLGVALATSASAWTYPPASGISVVSNAFSHLVGTNVQALLDYIDDNAVWTAAGYVTESWVDTEFSSTSTQRFGQVHVLMGPTNATLRLGTFYGFVASLTNGGTSVSLATNNLYLGVSNMVTAVYNPQTWYATNTGYFAPLVAGYYWLQVEALSMVDTNHLKITSQAGDREVWLDGSGTNKCESAGGIFYATGVSTNYFYVAAKTNTFSRLIFSGKFIGQ